MKITTEEKSLLIERLKEERENFATVNKSTENHDNVILFLETGERKFSNDDVFKNDLLNGAVLHPIRLFNTYCD